MVASTHYNPDYVPVRGDVVWINLEPQTGNEIPKRRPALVLSASTFNYYQKVAIVCPITRTVRTSRFDVAVPAGLYDEAIRLNPENFTSYANRAWAKNTLGQYESALTDCNEAICLKSDNAFAYKNRGIAYTGLEQIQEAKADFQMALELLEQVRNEDLKAEVEQLSHELENAQK